MNCGEQPCVCSSDDSEGEDMDDDEVDPEFDPDDDSEDDSIPEEDSEKKAYHDEDDAPEEDEVQIADESVEDMLLEMELDKIKPFNDFEGSSVNSDDVDFGFGGFKSNPDEDKLGEAQKTKNIFDKDLDDESFFKDFEDPSIDDMTL